MVTNYPHSFTSHDNGIRASAEDGKMDGLGGRVMDRLRQMYCGLHGHDTLLHFDKERISYKTKVTETQSWNDIPTCKEEGLDVQYLMLRAMFLPGKVTPEQQAFYVDLFQKVAQTPEYKEYMEKQALKPIFLKGQEMIKFLEEDDALNKSLMMEAGFAAR